MKGKKFQRFLGHAARRQRISMFFWEFLGFCGFWGVFGGKFIFISHVREETQAVLDTARGTRSLGDTLTESRSIFGFCGSFSLGTFG